MQRAGKVSAPPRPMTPWEKPVFESLLDSKGNLTPKFEVALLYIFLLYNALPDAFSRTGRRPSIPPVSFPPPSSSTDAQKLSKLSLSSSQLQTLLLDLSPPSHPLSPAPPLSPTPASEQGDQTPENSITSLTDSFSTNDKGELTWDGFKEWWSDSCRNQGEEEVWEDLKCLGFGSDLQLVGSRREDEDESANETR
ncbi:hypothetical protein BT69DRAFT_1279634 [Atractiella rhizophila]|nr:hypothetical protein BT69DRAFT_1279634 [Atractiella rhizophila]